MIAEQRAYLEKTAELLSGGWPSRNSVEMMLLGAMLDVASHNTGSGTGSHAMWTAALKALGQTCIAIADRERAKFK